MNAIENGKRVIIANENELWLTNTIGITMYQEN